MEKDFKLVAFEEYLRGRVRPGTVRVYINGVTCFLAAVNGGRVTADSAQAYVDGLAKTNLSSSTTSTRAHAIMRYLRWLGMNVKLDCPTITVGEPVYLTMQQLYKVVEACRTQLERVLVIVLFDTAIRISELLALSLSDVDWELKVIKVTRKGGRVEDVNIGDKALGELKGWLSVRQLNTESVFMGLTYIEAWRIIKKIGKRASVEVHPHIFRHTRAIDLLRNGVPINIVSQHLGHRSIATTMNIYGRFRAVEIKTKLTDW